MKLFTLFFLLVFSSLASAESGLLIKYEDGYSQLYIQSGLEYTLDELDKNIFIRGGFKSACYYGSPKDIKAIIEDMAFYSRITDYDGKIIPAFDENNELIENQVFIKANRKSVIVRVQYSEADESLYDINLSIKSCK